MNLELKRNKFHLIIGADYVNDYISKIEGLSAFGCQYVTILHDCDTDALGVLKNKHYHLICKLNDRIRASTFLNKISKLLECNAVNIQIDECYDYIACIQYLIHLNNSDKYQYDINQLVTNIDFEIIKSYMITKCTYELSAELLLQYVNSGMSKTDLLKTIGLSKFNCYYRVIDMLYR